MANQKLCYNTHMNYTLTDTGITIKKLFATKTIPFNEIAMLTYKVNSQTIVKTKDGEEIQVAQGRAFWNYESGIYEAIRAHNIPYEDEHEVDGQELFAESELAAMFEHTAQVAKDEAARILKAELGPNYDVEMVIRENKFDRTMFFVLLFNGVRVKVQRDQKVFDDVFFEDAFDNLELAYMCKWDPLRCEGVFCVTNELLDDAQCVSYVRDEMNEFLANYRAV